MFEDDEGFLYPRVDEQRCVNCNRCEQVCPVLKESKTASQNVEERVPRAYGGYHLNQSVRENSSSGGAFTFLAEKILSEGGVVWGCELGADLEARHIYVDSIDDLQRLRRSKYVQSDTRGVYSEVLKDLSRGVEVLFVGTPCQIAGLHAFLKKDWPNLLTCDFICHGVPSPGVFRAYVEQMQEEHSRIKEFHFRTKDRGWSSSALQLGTSVSFLLGDSLRNFPAFNDPFMCGFLSDLYLRPICYECPFKKLPRLNADITIADFWGVKSIYPELDDGKGTSLIITHTRKGDKRVNESNPDFFVKECDLASSISSNPMLTHSTRTNRKREAFFRIYKTQGFAAARKRYLSPFHWFVRKVIDTLFYR